jgi:hypothetical protein
MLQCGFAALSKGFRTHMQRGSHTLHTFRHTITAAQLQGVMAQRTKDGLAAMKTVREQAMSAAAETERVVKELRAEVKQMRRGSPGQGKGKKLNAQLAQERRDRRDAQAARPLVPRHQAQRRPQGVWRQAVTPRARAEAAGARAARAVKAAGVSGQVGCWRPIGRNARRSSATSPTTTQCLRGSRARTGPASASRSTRPGSAQTHARTRRAGFAAERCGALEDCQGRQRGRRGLQSSTRRCGRCRSPIW